METTCGHDPKSYRRRAIGHAAAASNVDTAKDSGCTLDQLGGLFVDRADSDHNATRR